MAVLFVNYCKAAPLTQILLLKKALLLHEGQEGDGENLIKPDL